MKRSWMPMWVLVASVVGAQVRAADDPRAIVARGVAALGGEAKLAQAKALQWKTVGKLTIDGNDNDFTVQTTTQGLDHLRSEVRGEFNGNTIRVTTVVDGKKGWRTFPETNALDEDGLSNEKRVIYLQVIPTLLLPLLDKAANFKLEAAGEGKVDGKPADVIKVTAPDGKDFRLLFDRATGLPVRTVATVVGFGGDDYEQVATYSDFKEMGGIQKAMLVDVLRNGDPFLKSTIKEFQTLDAAPAGTFAEPK